MSFQITPARSSRVTKATRPTATSSLLRRSTASPSSASPRRKSAQTPRPTANVEDDERLDDTGVMASLAADLNFRDVPQYMQYIRDNMFSPIPETGAGMNSTRISEVLNYRKNLPPIVTIAHIDALGSSSTKTEREVAELAQVGLLRRVTIARRGAGSANVGDGIATVIDWQQQVQSNAVLDEKLKAKYIDLMNANPTSTSIPGSAFTPSELSALTATGFLTTPNIPTQSSYFAYPGAGSLSSLSTAGSRHASGSLGAVGGAEATQHIHGGSGMGHRSLSTTHYNFSLPNTGSHIKLLVEARAHLLTLLKKSKYKEAPMDVLRERWDGGVPSTNVSEERRARREFAGILPGRTKKWKTFWGLRFEWILEECVGAGLVECFQTGSVGVGVRAL